MLRKYRTFIKYAGLYLSVFLISLIGIFYTIRINLFHAIENSMFEQMNSNASVLCETFENDFADLVRLSKQMTEKFALRENLYSNENYIKIEAYNEITNYILNNSLLTEIICLNTQTMQSYSGRYWVEYNNEELSIMTDQQDKISMSKEMILSKIGTISSLGKDNKTVMFIPPVELTQYLVIFVLDPQELEARLHSAFLPNIVNIQLVQNESIIFDTQDSGNVEQTSFTSHSFLCSYPQFEVQIWTNPELTQQLIENSLAASYAILFLTFLAGFVLFFVFIQNTYIPLKEFAQNIYKDSYERMRNVDIINLSEIYASFDRMQEKNKELLLEVHNYRTEVQKLILSKLSLANGESLQESELEYLFDQSRKRFYVVYFFLAEKESAETITSMVQNEVMQQNDRFFVLEKSKNAVSLLLAGETEAFADQKSLMDALMSILSSYVTEWYCSNGSGSIMNFPRLYEEVLQLKTISHMENSDQNYNMLPESKYPYQMIDEIRVSLMGGDGQQRLHLASELFSNINEYEYPGFYVQSIYLDVITAVFEQLHLKNIPFAKYSAAYYKALHLCKRKESSERDRVDKAIIDLIQLYNKLVQAPELTLDSVKLYIDKNYLRTDFSITEISEYYQVSISYFSSWFGKETGSKFIEYVWERRFTKAVELMGNSDLPTKDIPMKIGYLNYSSFSRKFKDYTGMTPNEYRSSIQK